MIMTDTNNDNCNDNNYEEKKNYDYANLSDNSITEKAVVIMMIKW